LCEAVKNKKPSDRMAFLFGGWFMSYRKIDPMDQYRKKEKLGHLKLIVLTFFIFAGWAFVHVVGTVESIQIKKYTINGVSIYILSLIFLILAWLSFIACAHVIRLSYIYLRIRRYIKTEIHYFMFHKIIRRIAIAIFWTMSTFYVVDFGCSKVGVINLFYYSTLNMDDDGFWAYVLWFTWMMLFFVINMISRIYCLGLIGIFNDDDLIVEDQ
jgi:hypothetical protein